MDTILLDIVLLWSYCQLLIAPRGWITYMYIQQGYFTGARTGMNFSGDNEAILKDMNNILKDMNNILKDMNNILKDMNNILKYMNNILKDMNNILKDMNNILKDMNNICWYQTRTDLNKAWTVGIFLVVCCSPPSSCNICKDLISHHRWYRLL